ncbi:MAG TPA: heme-binding protein, partial [Usitatibacter sp.]
MISPALRAAMLAASIAMTGCGGGSSGGGSAAGCGNDCQSAQAFLTESDVQRVIAQAVGEAQARGAHAQVAVVDRVGNVLAVFQMTGAPATVAISSGLGVAGGLDGVPAGTIPAAQAAITKAITGAYLSSAGNAFSTRTAGQIIQEHFDPNESQQPSGPLYGVQFSQLSCSDVNRNASQGTVGPKRSPLGLAADPGGLPLYKGGVLVGGVGIEADGRYGLDLDITDFDSDPEEIIAVAGAAGFAAPADIRGDRITADGRVFRYVDSEATLADPSRAPTFASLPGALAAVDGYNTGVIRAGTVFGSADSGVRPDGGALASSGAWILVDAANAARFAPRDASDGALHAVEVQAMLVEAIAVANRARGQIRRPLGSSAQVTIAVVDRNGDILGLVRTPDAPVFGIDVAVQKARTAMFFSHPSAAAELSSLPPAQYLSPPAQAPIASYVDAMRAFLSDPAALTGAIAWSARAVGNVHRPT